MTTQRPLLAILVAAALVTAAGASAALAARPLTVSPGSPDRLLEVASACPTFSWVADPAAGAYELRVYRVAEGGDLAAMPAGAPAADEGGPAEAELALRLRLPRGATSWTPPTSECLEPGGRYAWLVGGGGEGGRWSEARMFRVAPPARSELERAVERVLARFVEEGRLAPEGLLAVRALGDPEAAPSAAGAADPEASMRQGPQTRATTTGESGFMADLPATSGVVTFGVKGLSHSIEGDSAGVLGYSDAQSGKTYGVLGVTDSPGGRAVEGWARSPVGTTYGVSGIASSTGGSGVHGTATAVSGATRGVKGTVFSAAGVGGLFQNSAVGGIGLKSLGGGGAPDLELGSSGGVLVSSSLFRLDFTGAEGVFTVSASGVVGATGPVPLTFKGDGSLLTGIDEIGSGDILDDSVLSRHVKDGELLPADITGNAATATSAVAATALAADGANCPLGEVALGVDAAGNAQGCAPALAAVSCPPGQVVIGFDVDGTLACTAFVSPSTVLELTLAVCDLSGFPKPDFCPNIVFVTKDEWNGNLGNIWGADQKCADAASAAGLSGTFWAWISSNSTSTDIYDPAVYWIPSGRPYVRVDGVRIADNWSDLTDGSLAAPINVTEDGSGKSSPRRGVWTNTSPRGFFGGYDHCDEWSSYSNTEATVVGNMDDTTGGWSHDDYDSCDSYKSLYCFEQYWD